ncbi:hypothetical protein BpHYR1_003143 [Brachionus plicatilis]|uniref:Uncharacterized protein n=1 Tax=Brachionus plicatilis TaxID=10195 RepID=A0A3M7QAB2_BRAPC|nr:hypothetical protein BpHYR1_003143 [Brachionus plicatilis]
MLISYQDVNITGMPFSFFVLISKPKINIKLVNLKFNIRYFCLMKKNFKIIIEHNIKKEDLNKAQILKKT